MERANQETVVVVQIEHIDAVHRIDEIVSVPGLDCVFVGPYDLSGSLGKPGQVDDREVVSAIDHVLEVCRGIGMPLGTFGITRDVVLDYFEKGFRLLSLGMDTMFLAATAAKACSDLKSSVTGSS
jgi:2-keto-3-deoxy-L-rhamnonate aldolase RhmA